MFNLKIQALIIIFIFPVIQKAYGQTALDSYITYGRENNIVLQQKNISLEKAINSLKTANSYFIPSVNFNSGYTTGQGGRTISLPVGDLMNPVYSTLNQLTQENRFPQIENQEQSFFPMNFYDAHIRTSLPILNSDLYHNKNIRQYQVKLQELEVKTYERELIKNIKIAYYNYLAALEAEKIYQNTQSLVDRHLETSKSLVKNGKGLPASVLRAESEVAHLSSEMVNAQNSVINAQNYFNFLLNKNLSEPIIIEPVNQETEIINKMINMPENAGREELEMLETGKRINQSMLQMNRQFWLPKINGFFDLGMQAENMRFDSKARYYLVGVSMDIPLYNGNRNNLKVRYSESELKNINLSYDQTSRQLQLATEIARNNLKSANQAYLSSKQRLESAQSYFKLIERGYQEGVNSMIELIDARNQLTNAQIGVSIHQFKVMSAAAQLEREL